jgi:maleylpyruvate isomerase
VDTEITLALAQLGESTDRLLATADALTDAQAAALSRLPGWTRGHVLTHLARNADGFRNLLTWAGTGNETPMYPSEEARARDVEEGAGRSAAEIAADVQVSAAALAAAAQGLPAPAWDALVARRGVRFPAREIPSRRLAELEIHHVDLDAGYRPADWPASFVAANLVRVARDFAGRADAPALLARPDGLDAVYPIGPAGPDPALLDPAITGRGRTDRASQVTVSGPPAALLAWLIGRGNGAGLEVTGADAVPVLPPWR